MNVGIVCYPSVGGSGIVATELGLALCARKYSVHFISYDVPHRLLAVKPKCRFHQIRVPLYSLFRFPPYTDALAGEICRIAKECELDIIHVHYAIPHSTSALLAKMILSESTDNPPGVVTTLHGTDTDVVGLQPEFKPCVEWGINHSDAVTAVSRYLRRHTLESFNVKNDVEVIYNPINTKVFAPAGKIRKAARPFLKSVGINLEPGEKVVVHASNFRAVKRIRDVVTVFDLVFRVLPARLVLVGDGPDSTVAREMVANLGLGSRVHFLGKVLYVEQVLRDADLFLSTSEMESFGMSIAEAMACEVPVVASSVGGVPEVVSDGETGILFPCGDTKAAACAATEILTDPDKARTIGKNARERILRKFASEKVIPRYEAVYERLVD